MPPQPGGGKNQEVVTQLNWSWRGDDEGDSAVMGPLVLKVYSYLTRWLRNFPGEAIRYKLQMIEQQTQWLGDIDPSKAPVTLADGSAIDLLCESGGDSPSMLKQFSDLAAQEEIRRLVIVSPFWDVDLRGLSDLRASLGSPTTIVALNPRRNTFPVKALCSDDGLTFVAIDDTLSAKYLHAKIIVAQTRNADHILFGSANCSDDALGHLSGLSRNAEVSVYRRLSPGVALESLGIDLSKVVPNAKILPPLPIATSADAKKSFVPAGVIELRGQALAWWPPSTLSAHGAVIELGSISLTPHEVAGGKWVAEFTAKSIFPLIARIRYRDGLLSDLVIVHSESLLRKAAPGQVDSRLIEALRKARGPEGDLIELAAQANVIFEPAPRRVTTKDASGRTSQSKRKDREVVEYENEEEFRKAMETLPGTGKTGRMAEPGTGKTGRMAEDNPGLQSLLTVIGRGIANSLPQEDMDGDEQDKDLFAGDIEDDAEELLVPESKEDKGKYQPQQNTPSVIVTQDIKVFTAADMLLRRKQLVKALDLFDSMLMALNKNPLLITTRLPVQTMFVFRLMRYGLAHVHKISDDGSQKLMVMSERGCYKERPHSFVFRAAWILKYIWTGDSSIASRIRLDRRHSELPDDIYGFIVVSRWALARAYLEAKSDDLKASNGEPSKLFLALTRIGKEIYTATVAIGQVDAMEERQTIWEMDSDIGCTSAQTEELMRFLRELGRENDTTPT